MDYIFFTPKKLSSPFENIKDSKTNNSYKIFIWTSTNKIEFFNKITKFTMFKYLKYLY